MNRVVSTQLCFGLGLLLAAAELAASPTWIATLDPPATLDGEWKFLPGDDLARAAPAYDDSAWPSLETPGAWGRQGHRDVAVAWYRRTLRLPPAFNDETAGGDTSLGLTVGNISTGYQVFAGGELLGGVAGPPPEMAYDQHAIFVIPRRAVSADGSLVIAFRIWRADAVGQRSGGLRQAPQLGYLADLTRRQLRRQQPALFLAFLFIAVGLYHLVLYWLRARETAYLWYSLLVLTTAAYTFLGSQNRFLVSDNYIALKEMEYLAAFLFPSLGIQFFWTLLSTPISRPLRLYQLSHPALGLLAVLTPGLELNLIILSWWTFWTLPAVIMAIALLSTKAIQGDAEARIVAAGTTIVIGTYFHSLLAANNLVAGSNMIALGFLVFVLSMAISLAYRFSRVHQQLDLLRADLEQRVLERTRQLEEAKASAITANQAKSDFLANMSHEIRTPMGGILGLLELLAKKSMPAEARQHMRTLESSAESLLRIIDDILDVSKIEAGKMSLESRPFGLRQTVDAVIDLLQPRAEDKGIELRAEVETGLPDDWCGDSARLRQVLVNLVGNGVKFTEQGWVRVVVERARAKNDPASDAATTVRFSVQDTGIGIEPEVQSQLFRPFTQADSSSARRFGGTGLGLVISKSIVEMAGGEIRLDSQPSQGSTFSFTWPLQVMETREPAPKPASDNPKQSADRATSHLLLAEDNPVLQMIAVRQIQDLGYEVEAVASGHEALQAMDQKDYDLVLMDCQMPGLDGYETTRRIRQREIDQRHTPIIAVTAHAMEGDREKCLAAGMDDYLTKPYREKVLARLIRQWLSYDER